MAKDPRHHYRLLRQKTSCNSHRPAFCGDGHHRILFGTRVGKPISRELSNMFGGDNELLLYVISTLQLISGLFLGARLFTKLIPDKITKLAYTAILIFWVALIVILDVSPSTSVASAAPIGSPGSSRSCST